jgi:hypothetical protein
VIILSRDGAERMFPGEDAVGKDDLRPGASPSGGRHRRAPDPPQRLRSEPENSTHCVLPVRMPDPGAASCCAPIPIAARKSWRSRGHAEADQPNRIVLADQTFEECATPSIQQDRAMAWLLVA